MKIRKYSGTESVFPYIVYESDQLSEHPAVILQLHGAGERGHGGEELDWVAIHGLTNAITEDNFRDCVLVMPQCPPETFWVARIESIKRFLDEIIRQYDADPGRITLCGISMGGYGTWFTAMAYPDVFAAIAPCCGGGMAWNAGVLKMPVWAFHGKEDTLVSPDQTIEMIEKLQDNPNVRLTLFDGVGHDSHTRAFSAELLQWLLAQHK